MRRNSEYKHKVGDIIERKTHNIKILEQTRIKNCDSTQKAYVVECLRCGSIYETAETHITRGTGCGFCSQKIRRASFKYRIGDIMQKQDSQLLILNRFYFYSDKLKRYKYLKSYRRGCIYKTRCLKCGDIEYYTEMSLEKLKKCVVCNNKKIQIGYNDLATTHPEFIKYFVNPEESKTVTYSANTPISIKCPICGNVKKNKIPPNKFVTRGGIRCDYCSDGVSFNEKLMMSLLEQLNIDYYPHKKFKWSDNREYDFYLPQYEIIIETHGFQHYKENTLTTRTLKEEQINDKYKKDMALKNNITTYIEIDCKIAEFDYIKGSIMKSKLNKIFDLTLIDWDKCEKDGLYKNIIKECSDFYNENYKNKTITQMSLEYKMAEAVFISYIERGRKLGLCKYIPLKCKNIIIIDYKLNKLYLLKSAKDGIKKSEHIFGKKCCHATLHKYSNLNKNLNKSRTLYRDRYLIYPVVFNN